MTKKAYFELALVIFVPLPFWAVTLYGLGLSIWWSISVAFLISILYFLSFSILKDNHVVVPALISVPFLFIVSIIYHYNFGYYDLSGAKESGNIIYVFGYGVANTGAGLLTVFEITNLYQTFVLDWRSGSSSGQHSTNDNSAHSKRSAESPPRQPQPDPGASSKRHPDDAKFWAFVDDPNAAPNERIMAISRITKREMERKLKRAKSA